MIDRRVSRLILELLGGAFKGLSSLATLIWISRHQTGRREV